MKQDVFSLAVPGFVALLAVILLVAWLGGAPEVAVQARVPSESAPRKSAAPVVDLRGSLVKLEGKAAELAGEWPGFRGPHRDNIGRGNVPLLREWPQEGPPVLWKIDVGEGYAAAAILGGRVYVMDYDHAEQADVLRCLSLADGKDIWRYSYRVAIKRNHGMSRTVPAVTEKHVVALGPKCHVTCLDSKTGEYKWSLDLVKEYGTKVPGWYAGQCPLIDGDRAIIAPAGDDVLMMAVECETGEVAWRAPNPRKWKMTHASVAPMEFAGRRMYVYCGSGGVAGVAADDGTILWETPAWRINVATVPSPVVVGDGRIFLSGGYNAGSMMLQLEEENGALTAETAFRLNPKVFGSDQQTPIFYNGCIYGVIPKGQFACLDLEGNQIWASGSDNRFGLGPYLIADGMILVMNDAGLLTMAEATPDGYREVAQAKVLSGHDSWGPMAIAGGRLILRDLTTMVCLDLREQ